jgi:hypothetical protein
VKRKEDGERQGLSRGWCRPESKQLKKGVKKDKKATNKPAARFSRIVC